MYEIIEEKEPLNAIQVRNVRLRTMGNLELLKGTAAVSLLIIAILGGARGRWGEGVGWQNAGFCLGFDGDLMGFNGIFMTNLDPVSNFKLHN